MMKLTSFFYCSLCCLLISSSYAKNTIYKCKDDNGRTIFSQQAACSEPEMVNYSAKRLADKKKQENLNKQKNVNEKRQTQCNEAKATSLSYERAPFLTKTVYDDGKAVKVRLSKEDADQARSDAKSEVGYWCKEQ